MDFPADVTLTYSTSIAVISALWNQEDIISDINKVLLECQTAKQWTEIEDKVLKCLKQLDLPDTLKISLENFIQPLGVQILKWIGVTRVVFQAYPYNEKSLYFIWTGIGTLDLVKTTQLIIEYNHINKLLCFALACIFCIEKTIFNLWPDVKQSLSERLRWNLCDVESVPVVYWVFYLNDEVESFMNSTEYCTVRNAYEFGFLLNLDTKCIPSLNYFLSKTETERKKKLILLAFESIFRSTRPRDGNVLVFLFRHLREVDIKNELICDNAYSVLACFLEWPCHKFFLSLADFLWDNLSNSEYLNLLQDILEYVSRFYIGDLYKRLFQDFWKASPTDFKQYVIHKCSSGTFLSRLFLFGNTDDIIQIIFKECSPEERQSMIFYFEGMNICDILIKKERWDSLKMFVQNCIPSCKILEEFIEQYQSYKPSYCDKETETRTETFIKNVRLWY